MMWRILFFFIYCQIYNDCSVNKLMEVNRLFSFGDWAIVAYPSEKIGKIEKDRVPDISISLNSMKSYNLNGRNSDERNIKQIPGISFHSCDIKT